MSGDITPYTDLLPSENKEQPNFRAALAAVLQPFADITAQIEGLVAAFDLDSAAGQQLDFIGQWIGLSRVLKLPITGVFFSFDTPGVGFDQGVWIEQYQASTGLLELPDDKYRLVLFVKILNNVWDGSLGSAYSIYDALFASINYVPFIKDNADGTMELGIANKVPDALTKALLEQGYLNVKPAGVQVVDYITPSQDGPIFAFDVNTQYFAGFDTGAFSIHTAPA